MPPFSLLLSTGGVAPVSPPPPPPPVPVADFAANPISGTVPFDAQFTDESTNSPTGWTWVLDGSTTFSTQQNPLLTVVAAGDHDVTLTASNAGGASTPVTKTAYLHGTAPSSFDPEFVGSGTPVLILDSVLSTLTKVGGGTAADGDALSNWQDLSATTADFGAIAGGNAVLHVENGVRYVGFPGVGMRTAWNLDPTTALTYVFAFRYSGYSAGHNTYLWRQFNPSNVLDEANAFMIQNKVSPGPGFTAKGASSYASSTWIPDVNKWRIVVVRTNGVTQQFIGTSILQAAGSVPNLQNFTNRNRIEINTGPGGGDSGLNADLHAAYVYSGWLNQTDIEYLQDGLAARLGLTLKYPSGKSYITTAGVQLPIIPNEAAQTVRSVASGNWSATSTWSGGSVPAGTDVVGIYHTVTQDSASAAARGILIKSGGVLSAKVNANTKLTVQDVFVHTDGELRYGNTGAPIQAGFLCELVWKNAALNLSNLDPNQWGNGLLAVGKVRMCGLPRDATFHRVAAEPLSGNASITFAVAPTGWSVGDELYIPDTHQLPDTEHNPGVGGYTGYLNQSEDRVITAISGDGKTFALNSALSHNHKGGYKNDGTLTFLPHVANYSSNINVYSEAPLGVRGCCTFFERADIDIRYTQFGSMGRTTTSTINDTVINDDGGIVGSLGTNQEGLYPITFFKHYGPAAGAATVGGTLYQGVLLGNSIVEENQAELSTPQKWGVTVWESHWLLVRDNFVWNWAGANIACPIGSEWHNTIDANFSAACSGGGDRLNNGGDGVGLWFHGTGNVITNNVSNNSHGGQYSYGLSITAVLPGSVGNSGTEQPLGSRLRPTAQGDDPNVTAPTSWDPNDIALPGFSGNELYGALASGATMWNVNSHGFGPAAGTGSGGTVGGLIVWNCWNNGFFAYSMSNVTFSGCTWYGDPTLVASNNASLQGFYAADYSVNNCTLSNCDFQSFDKAVLAPMKSSNGAFTFTIDSCTFVSLNGIYRETPNSVNPGGPGEPRDVIVSNCTFAACAVYPGHGRQDITSANSPTIGFGHVNMVLLDRLFLNNYNGDGLTRRVYYDNQAAGFTMPASDSNSTGAPDGTHTNQNWTDAFPGQSYQGHAYNWAGEQLPSGTGTVSFITGPVK